MPLSTQSILEKLGIEGWAIAKSASSPFSIRVIRSEHFALVGKSPTRQADQDIVKIGS